MSLLTLLALLLVTLYLVVLVLVYWGNLKHQPSRQKLPDPLPRLSILVAARNEEANISGCLESLVQLDYPKELLDIWVGNDGSTDDTKALVQTFVDTHAHIHLLDIEEPLGQAKGKANVLAQLAHKASGTYFLITDADIRVPPTWAKGLLQAFTPQTGLVSGTTAVLGTNRTHKLQEQDWLFLMGVLQGFLGFGIPCSGVGNNMALRAEAYWSTGGYEQIPFSVTEDLKLYQEIRKQGWHTQNLYEATTFNRSTPLPDLETFMQQRQRWLVGAKGLSAFWWTLFVIFAGNPFAIFWLALFQSSWVLQVLALQWITHGLLMRQLYHQLNLTFRLPDFLTFAAYNLLTTPIVAASFFWPSKVRWKGRQY